VKSAEALIIAGIVAVVVVLSMVGHWYYGNKRYSEGYAAAQTFDRKVAQAEAKRYEERIAEAEKGRRSAEDLLMLARSRPFGGLVCYKTGTGRVVLGGEVSSGTDGGTGLLPDKVVGDTEPKGRGTVRSH
jgi:hypothetical protein